MSSTTATLSRCFCMFVNRNNYNSLSSTKRFIYVHSVLAKNHYDVLGITPKATQTDVKAAYYRLSMVYHPDKNEGCNSASEKFRDITTAYEVLGNFKLRRLYDKGECRCVCVCVCSAT